MANLNSVCFTPLCWPLRIFAKSLNCIICYECNASWNVIFGIDLHISLVTTPSILFYCKIYATLNSFWMIKQTCWYTAFSLRFHTKFQEAQLWPLNSSIVSNIKKNSNGSIFNLTLMCMHTKSLHSSFIYTCYSIGFNSISSKNCIEYFISW